MRLSTLALLLSALLLGCSGEEPGEGNMSTNRAEESTTTKDTNQVSESTGTEGRSKPTADSEPVPGIQFEREQSFGSTDEVLLGNIIEFVVDDTGRVLVTDWDQALINVFNPDGSYLTSLGREGRGPGEFNHVQSIKVHYDQLWAVDFNQIPTRINIFSLDSMTFSHTIKLPAGNQGEHEKLDGYLLDDFYPGEDSTFLGKYENHTPKEIRTRYYYRHDRDANIINGEVLVQQDKNLVHEFRSGPLNTVSYGDFPFIGGSIFAVSSEGNIYSARTEKFLIKVYDRNGKYLREFEHLFRRKEINRQEIMESIESETRRETIANNKLPERWPALESMFFDDENRLWVATIVDDMEIYEWWILKDTGEVITKFEWPRDHPIEEVRNGKLYARETDEETGLGEIVRYDIEMEPG